MFKILKVYNLRLDFKTRVSIKFLCWSKKGLISGISLDSYNFLIRPASDEKRLISFNSKYNSSFDS